MPAAIRARHPWSVLRSGGRELVIYLAEETGQEGLLAGLGPHRMGRACLYVKRLADLEPTVLEALVRASVATLRQRYQEVGQGG